MDPTLFEGLLQYGALGLFCLYLVYRDIAQGKKRDLEDVKRDAMYADRESRRIAADEKLAAANVSTAQALAALKAFVEAKLR